MVKILNSTRLVVFLILFAAVANGSIKWRRVTKTTPTAIHTTSTEATPSATKTPITWRRSTLSRKSTTKRDVASHEEEHEEEREEEHKEEHKEEHEEEEEIEMADSKEDISVLAEDTQQEPSINPLVPGSRPGFWFDSSRRKKPSSLLRPGSRKSSLFPSKPSTTAIKNTTTESPILNSVQSVTTPRSIHSSELNHTLNSKPKVLGRNHSTKPPIAFRRRLKTTKSSRNTTTTAVPEVKELDIEKELLNESEQDITAKEISTVSSISDDIPIENINNKSYESVRLPGSGIRRRLRNGTRVPWRKDGGRFTSNSTTNSLLKISRTTPFPQSKSSKTTPKKVTTPGYSRSTRKPTVPSKVKSRTKTNKTTSLPHRTRTKSSTPIPVIISDSKAYAKKPTAIIKGPTNFLRNRNVHRFNRLKPNLIPGETEEEEQEKYLSVTTHEPLKEFEFIENISPELELSTKSTAEPFYITRDYGELVTAIPEVRRKKGRIPNRTTTSTPATELYAEIQDGKKLQSEEVNDLKIDTINRETELPLDNNLKSSAKDESFKFPESISRHSVQLQRSTTPKPSMTIPFISPTIDPGTNAYVVWSLGQGGSGWSYEKQGGQVKWSAQNSQAEGDRWSVQGAEEKGTSSPAVWGPTNTTFSTYTDKTKEWVVPDTEVNKQVSYTNDQKSFHNTNYWTPVTYMPNIPYKNETFLKLTTLGDIKTLSPNDIRGYSPLPPGITDFSPIIFQNAENNLSSGYPVQNIEAPAFGTNAHYQNIETEAYTLTNRTSSINLPNTSENGNIYTEIHGKEQINVQEYLTQPPTTSDEWNLPTTVAAPLKSFYGLELENQFLKSTIPSFQTDEIPPFDISAVPESFVEEIRSNVDSTDNVLQEFNQQVRDLSGIPPELAKAVVDAKRWTVVGTGGEEGWSLLGENGQLEWKIHDMNGRWSVVSGDKLLKLPVQVSSPYQEARDDDRNERVDLNQENGKSTLDSPKIWKLEDDYNKWKVLSAEGGIQVESPEVQWIPTREYEYDQNDELEDDYYDDDGDYEVLSGNNFSPPSQPEMFDDRPHWGAGETQIVLGHPGGKSNNQQLVGGIESANTKEDAIESWKSLIVDQDNWKNSKENFEETPGKYFNYKHAIARQSTENSEWKKQTSATSEPFVKFPETDIKETYSRSRPSEKNNKSQEKRTFKHNSNNNIQVIDETSSHFNENQDKGDENKPNSQSNFHHKDHAKIDMLINKLEKVQKGANGRAVVDLSQLLKLIKTNRNLTSLTLRVKTNPDVRNRTRETDLIDTRVRDYNNDIYQKLGNQEDSSKLQRYPEPDKFPSKNQYEQIHDIHKTYSDKYKQNRETSEERFSNTPKTLPTNSRFKNNFPLDTVDWQNEEVARDKNVPFRTFNKDIIYNQEHGKADQNVKDNLPFRVRNNQVSRPFEEPEANQMNSLSKHKKERNPNTESIPNGNNQNSFRHFNVNNSPELSNFEDSPEEQRITVSKNHEVSKYDSDINSSSEEYKIRRKLPFDSPGHRRKTGNDAERSTYSDTGTDNQLFNVNRQVPRNKPKRKRNRFHAAPSSRPREHHQNLEDRMKHIQHTENNNPHPNQNSNEKYTTNDKYQTSRNRRKRPQVGKSRHRSSGKPGHSNVRSGTRYSLDSSSEKLMTDGRKQPQVFEGYERYRSPEESTYESSPEVYPMKQRQRVRLSKPNQPSPIVISSETEIEDDEDGSKKNRKIIVIDYAGRQKKKSPIDRKDLELIIRSVKNRRSGIMEDVSKEDPRLDTLDGQ